MDQGSTESTTAVIGHPTAEDASCGCITRINEQLKGRNTRLRIALCPSKDLGEIDALPIIATDKIDTKLRTKPLTVIPNFCPFCGTEYPRKDSEIA